MSSLTLVDLGHCRIALPHTCIATIENISDAKPDESTQRSYWQVQRGAHHWKLYALDDDLQPQALFPHAHRLALCFKQQPLALSCARIETLTNPQITPLPFMMRKAGSPVTGLILHNGAVALQIDTTMLFARLMAHQDYSSHTAQLQETHRWNAQLGI